MRRNDLDREAQRQAVAAATADSVTDDQSFVEAVSADWDDEVVVEQT